MTLIYRIDNNGKIHLYRGRKIYTDGYGQYIKALGMKGYLIEDKQGDLKIDHYR